MKILDIVHSFADDQSAVSRGMCRVRSFATAAGIVVLLTELSGKNHGQSVTNAVERIIGSLLKEGKVIPPAVFVEHYERDFPQADSFTLVELDESLSPRWKEITREQFIQLASCSPNEVDDRSARNVRISIEADRIRFAGDAFRDSPYPKSNEWIKREIEIIKGMIRKTEIEKLVYAGENEQALQRLLKRDLSLFGDMYADQPGEYICFSEFPIGDGAVDIAVFTGRSRLEVILIELKGAEFNLLNSGHYAKFNHKIDQAADQIRLRLRWVYESPTRFRDFAHDIRKRAEKGERVHNAFLGPSQRLEVDSRKDFTLRTVMIGGRTVDDLAESRKRHDYEVHSTPPVRVESWDTWLRKLQRQ